MLILVRCVVLFALFLTHSCSDLMPLLRDFFYWNYAVNGNAIVCYLNSTAGLRETNWL